jgi:hypothetical protein
MATKIETDEERRARQQKQDRARFDKGVAAAEAVLLPLGFARATGKDYFTKEGRAYARWHLEDPRIGAHLDLQSKPYFSGAGAVADHEDPYTYRLKVSADYGTGVKDIRVSPGNRPAVVDFIARAKAGLQASQAYEEKVANLANDARTIVAGEFPNLKITSVDADDDRTVVVRVKNKAGARFSITLNGRLKFLALKITADEDLSTPLETVRAALRAL